MPSIHDVFKDDEPSVPASNIVGSYYLEGRCYYEGRPQGSKLAAESEEELVDLLAQKRREILKEQGSVASYIYPNNDAWELRIFRP